MLRRHFISSLVPKKDIFVRYCERITSRPAFQRINAAAGIPVYADRGAEGG